MAVPKYESFYRPILEIVSEAKETLVHKEIIRQVIERLSICEEDQKAMTKNGSRTQVESHSRFAVFNLRKAGLIYSVQLGKLRITNEGRQYLKDHPDQILDSEIRSLVAQLDSGVGVPEDIEKEIGNVTPDDKLADSYQQLEDQLVDDILDQLKGVSPTSFERLVNRLLSKMGYGEIEVEHGHSGDGGIDGILNQDLLGLEKVYVQAKRYGDSLVREPEIRLFHSSLTAKGASKGVFITSSTFHESATKVARDLSLADKFIRLIDGNELAELMISHGVGVVTEITYEVKKLDANYFAEV